MLAELHAIGALSFALGLVFSATEAAPSTEAADSAYERKDVAELTALANQGIAAAQTNLGVMYSNGTGVPQDYILAHMWLNLAASSLEGPDRRIATTGHNLVAGLMTPAQIDRAQSMARVCQASNFKTCGY